MNSLSLPELEISLITLLNKTLNEKIFWSPAQIK